MQNKISTQLIISLMAIFAAGWLSEKSKVPKVRSPLVPFDELFETQDTQRLNPIILGGQFAFLDVSAREEILGTDHLANRAYLFPPSGNYLGLMSKLGEGSKICARFSLDLS